MKMPKTFGDFRLFAAAGLKKVGYPERVVFQVADTNLEGGSIASECWTAYQIFNEPCEDEEDKLMQLSSAIHDLAVMLSGDYWARPVGDSRNDGDVAQEVLAALGLKL